MGKCTRLILSGLISLVIIFVQYSVSWHDRAIYWGKWYLLEIAEPLDVSEVTAHLEENGVHDFLAASNTVVPFMAIPGLERRTVDSLEKILIAGDPRRDPFLALVGSIFKAGDNSLVFLPASRSLDFYSNIINQIEQPDSLKFLDKTSSFTFFRAGIFTLFVSIVIFLTGKGKSSYIIFSLLPQVFPWLVFIIVSRTASPYIGVIFHMLTFEKFEYGKRGLLFPGIASVIGILGLQFYLCIPAERLDMLIALTAFLLIMLSRYVLLPVPVRTENPEHRNNKAGREHRLFVPVQLTGVFNQDSGISSASPAIQISQAWFAIIIALLFILVLLLPYPRLLPHNNIPTAGRSVLSFDDWSEFPHFLASSRDTFPHFVDLLMSRSYQEGFLYGAEYRLPEMGDSLVMERYIEKGNKIEVVLDTLIKYDSQWFGNLLETELQTGIGLLYASIGGIASIRSVNLPPGTKSVRQVYICNILLLLTVIVYRLVFFFSTRNKGRKIPERRPFLLQVLA